MYKFNKIFASGLFCLTVSLFINCADSLRNSTVSTNSAPISYEKPIFIQSVDLLKEYNENSAAADERYKGKLLAVSGKTTGFFGSDDESLLWIGINNEGLTNLSAPDPKEIECGNGDVKKMFKGKIDLEDEVVLVGVNQGMNPGITKETFKNILLKNCRVESKSFSDSAKN